MARRGSTKRKRPPPQPTYGDLIAIVRGWPWIFRIPAFVILVPLAVVHRFIRWLKRG